MTDREIAIKIVRLFARTPSDKQHDAFIRAAVEGHGPALFRAIEAEGMLAPIVRDALNVSPADALLTAKRIITLAANSNMFGRNDDGSVTMPQIRPVAGFEDLFEQYRPKSVLDEPEVAVDFTEMTPDALLAMFNVPPVDGTL